MQIPHIFISACEPSGDLHGANIAQQLLAKWPHCKLDGIGGPRMRKLFAPSFAQEEFAVMGFADVVMALPRLLRNFCQIRRYLLRSRPDLIITIDYPVGHLLLMRHLKRSHLFSKWVHFVAPSMWVGGKKRLHLLQKYADHLAVIFPHEVDLLRPFSLPCTFVGNPLQLALQDELPNMTVTPPLNPLVAIFPGSRLAEIERNLSLLLSIGKKLTSPAQIRISSCREKSDSCPLQQSITKIAGNQIAVVYPQESKQLMQDCALALAVSGTICLELALLQVPTLVIYRLGTIDWMIARYVLRLSLPFYSLPNLLAKQIIYPEFYGKDLDERSILKSAQGLLFDPLSRQRCRLRCDHLRKILATSKKGSIAQIADDLISPTFKTKSAI